MNNTRIEKRVAYIDKALASDVEQLTQAIQSSDSVFIDFSTFATDEKKPLQVAEDIGNLSDQIMGIYKQAHGRGFRPVTVGNLGLSATDFPAVADELAKRSIPCVGQNYDEYIETFGLGSRPIHIENGAAYVSSAHSEDEIVDALRTADRVYVDARQLDLDAAIAEAHRINDVAKKAKKFNVAVIGIQGDPMKFNGEGAKIGGLTATTEHFDAYKSRPRNGAMSIG